MSCTLSQASIDEVVAFHGHWCPGLAIGIRAAETALQTFQTDGNGSLVAVVETDMCGVDAIQFLTSCTLGKGNLIHRDWGKIAFSFYDREAGDGVRMLLRPEARADMDLELEPLAKRVYGGTASKDEIKQHDDLRVRISKHFMRLGLDEMFSQTAMPSRPPRPARILQSLTCDHCGERCMESRTRRLAGKTYCIPCFDEVDQKL